MPTITDEQLQRIAAALDTIHKVLEGARMPPTPARQITTAHLAISRTVAEVRKSGTHRMNVARRTSSTRELNELAERFKKKGPRY